MSFSEYELEELPEAPQEIDFVRCPHCGQKEPIYEVVASVSEIDPHREAKLGWVRVDWHLSAERPIEATYSRGCPKHAGPLELFHCKHCKGVVYGPTLEQLTSRKRMADDEELIWWMQQLMAELERMPPWMDSSDPMLQERRTIWLDQPDIMFEERDFGVTRRHLCEYLITAMEVRQQLEALERSYDGLYVRLPERFEHNWEAMLKLIKQAERMDRLRYPLTKKLDALYTNGVVMLRPNGKYEVVLAKLADFGEPIWQWQRRKYFGAAYQCTLGVPERSFSIHQMSDVEPVSFWGVIEARWRALQEP